MIKSLDHLVITTENAEKCGEFYGKIGFTVKDQGNRYALYGGGIKINIHFKGKELEPKATHVQVGSADLCFEVGGDLGQMKAELEGKGILIELGIVERNGVRGPMRSIYMRDPDLNLIELCSYK